MANYPVLFDIEINTSSLERFTASARSAMQSLLSLAEQGATRGQVRPQFAEAQNVLSGAAAQVPGGGNALGELGTILRTFVTQLNEATRGGPQKPPGPRIGVSEKIFGAASPEAQAAGEEDVAATRTAAAQKRAETQRQLAGSETYLQAEAEATAATKVTAAEVRARASKENAGNEDLVRAMATEAEEKKKAAAAAREMADRERSERVASLVTPAEQELIENAVRQDQEAMLEHSRVEAQAAGYMERVNQASQALLEAMQLRAVAERTGADADQRVAAEAEQVAQTLRERVTRARVALPAAAAGLVPGQEQDAIAADRVAANRERLGQRLSDLQGVTPQDIQTQAETKVLQERQKTVLNASVLAQTTEADINAQVLTRVAERARAEQERLRYAEQMLAGDQVVIQLEAQRRVAEEEVNAAIKQQVGKLRGTNSGGFFQAFGQGFKQTAAGGEGGGGVKGFLSNLGGQFGGYAGFAVTAALFFRVGSTIRELVRDSEEFDRKLRDIRGTMESIGQGDAFGKMRDDILGIARDTGVSNIEVATLSQEFLGLFQNETKAAQATRDTAELIRVIGGTAAEVGPQVGALVENLGVSTKEINDAVIDIQDRTGRSGKDAVAALSALAPVANELNLNLGQTRGLIEGIAAGSSRSGQQIGEGLARILPELQKNLPKVQQLGINLSPAARGGDAAAGLQDILSQYGKLSQAQQQLVTSQLGGPRFAQILAAAFADPDRALKLFNSDLQDSNAFANRYRESQESLRSQLDRFRQSAEQLGESLISGPLGQALTDLVRLGGDTVSWISDVVGWLRTLNDMTGGTIGKLLELYVAMRALQSVSRLAIVGNALQGLSALPGSVRPLSALALGGNGAAEGEGVFSRIAARLNPGFFGGGTDAAGKTSAATSITAAGESFGVSVGAAGESFGVGVDAVVARLVAAANEVAQALMAGGTSAEASMTEGGAAAGAELDAGAAAAGGAQAAGGAAGGLWGPFVGGGAAGAGGASALGGSEAGGVAAGGAASGGALLAVIAAMAVAEAINGEIKKRSNKKIKDTLEHYDKMSDDELRKKAADPSSTGAFGDPAGGTVETGLKYARNAIFPGVHALTHPTRYFHELTHPSGTTTGDVAQDVLNSRVVDSQREAIQNVISDGLVHGQKLKDLQAGLDNPEDRSKFKALERAWADLAKDPKVQEQITLAEVAKSRTTAIQSVLGAANLDITTAQQAVQSWQEGNLSYDDAIKAVQAEIEAYKGFPDPTAQKQYQQDINLLTKLRADHLKAVTESTITQAQVLGTDTPLLQIGAYTDAIRSPDASPQSRLESAKGLATAERQQFQQLLQNAHTVEEVQRIIDQGMQIPADVQNAIREAFLTQTITQDNSQWQTLLKDLQTSFSGAPSAFADLFDATQLAKTAVETGKSLKQVMADAIKKQIADTLEVLARVPNFAARQDILGDLDELNKDLAAINAAPDVATPGAVTLSPEQQQQAADKLAQTQRETTAAIRARARALAHGDQGKDLSADLAAAQSDYATALKEANGNVNDPRVVQADAAVTDVKNQQTDYANSLVRSRLELRRARAAGNPVAQAQAQLEEANLDLANAHGEEQQIRAQIEQVEANNALNDALAAVSDARHQLVEAQLTAAGDPIGAAQDRVANDTEKLNALAARLRAQGQNPETNTDYINLQRQLTEDRSNAVQTQISETERQIDTDLQLNRTSTAQAINRLKALESVAVNQTQRDEIEIKIKELIGAAQKDIAWNLPSNIQLPTLYEIRRTTETGGLNHYQDNRQINNNITIGQNMGRDEIVGILSDAMATGGVVYGSTTGHY